MWVKTNEEHPKKDGMYKVLLKCWGVDDDRGISTEKEWKKNKWDMSDFGPEAPYYYVDEWETCSWHKKEPEWVTPFGVSAKEVREIATKVADDEDQEVLKFLHKAEKEIRRAARKGKMKVDIPFGGVTFREEAVWRIIHAIAKKDFLVQHEFVNGKLEGLTIFWDVDL